MTEFSPQQDRPTRHLREAVTHRASISLGSITRRLGLDTDTEAVPRGKICEHQANEWDTGTSSCCMEETRYRWIALARARVFKRGSQWT